MSAPSRLSNNIPSWLLLMGLVTAIGPLAVDMYLPSFTTIAHEFDVPTSQVERTLASYLLGLSLAQLAYGPITDRFGRRLPLMIGLIIFIVASLMCSLANSVDELTFWRVIQAIGSASGMVIPRAVIRDKLETQDAARALSLLMLIMGVTPILAPILGGQVLLFWDWRGIFFIMLFCSLLMLIGVAKFMHETLVPAMRTPLSPLPILRSYVQLLRDRVFMGYALAGGFGSAGMFSYIAGSPRTFIEIYHVDPSHFGLLFGINAFALIAASQVSARLLRKHSPDALLEKAQTAMMCAVWLTLMLTLSGLMTLPLLMVGLVAYMSCQGFVNPNAAALALDGQGHRLGVASALMGSLLMLAGAAAGAIISLWHSTTEMPLVGILTACATLSWLFGRMARHARLARTNQMMHCR